MKFHFFSVFLITSVFLLAEKSGSATAPTSNAPAATAAGPANYDKNNRQCVAGSEAHREVANSFHQFNEPATQRFQQMVQNGQRPWCDSASAFSPTSNQRDAARNLSSVANQLQQQNPGEQAFPIQPRCLIAALSRQSGTSAFHCPNDGAGAGQRINSNQCFTPPMVDFIHQSVGNALSCVKNATGISFDPITIFKKINNESGFRPFYSYNGGHGIGQLIGGTAAGIAQGRSDFGTIMSSIADSNDSSCSDFKNIIQSDRANPIRGSNAIVQNGRCRFLSMGQGMQRNLIYSLMLRASLSKTITARFKAQFPNQNMNSPQNKELVGNLINVGYGPGGPRAALALLRSAGRSGSADGLRNAVSRNTYIRSINGSYNEVLRLSGTSASTNEERDRACLVN